MTAENHSLSRVAQCRRVHRLDREEQQSQARAAVSQRMPCLHARPGRYRPKLIIFELRFRRSGLDPSGTRRARDAPALSLAVLCVGSEQQAWEKCKCHRPKARVPRQQVGHICDQLISAAKLAAPPEISLGTASQLHSLRKTRQRETSHGFTALRRRHHEHGAAQHREQPDRQPNRSRRGHDQHLGGLS